LGKARLLLVEDDLAVRNASSSDLPRDPYLRIASKPIRAEELLTLVRALLTA
jgi:hypothetical protein